MSTLKTKAFFLLAGLAVSCSDSPMEGASDTLDIQYQSEQNYCIDSANALLLPGLDPVDVALKYSTEGTRLSVALGKEHSDSGSVKVALYCGTLPMGEHVYQYGDGVVTEKMDDMVKPDSQVLWLSQAIAEHQLPKDSASLYLAVAYAMIAQKQDLRGRYTGLDLGGLDSALAAIGIQNKVDKQLLLDLGLSSSYVAQIAQELLKSNAVAQGDVSSYLDGNLSSSSAGSSSSSSASNLPDTTGLGTIVATVQRGATDLHFSNEFQADLAMSRFEATRALIGDTTSNSGNAADSLSFYDAVLLCNKLSRDHHLDTLYSYTFKRVLQGNIWLENLKVNASTQKGGYRLPTWTEWKTAYYYGTSKTSGFYWESGTVAQNARTSVVCAQAKCKVGEYAPNLLGIYDMTGNMDEWVMPSGLTTLTGLYDSTQQNSTYQLFGVVGLSTDGTSMAYADKIGSLRMPNRGIRLVKVSPSL